RKTPAPEDLHETPDLAGQFVARTGCLEPEDPHLFLERGVLDEEVQAAPAQRVADLAAPIRRENHVRDVFGADRSNFRDRYLKVGQDFEQERLEALVRAIDLVDQQDRRTFPR